MAVTKISVELFGVCRKRAGVAGLDVEADTLGQALHRVGVTLPRFAEACLDGERLKPGYIANLNGQRFVTDSATLLTDGDALLILSADAGG